MIVYRIEREKYLDATLSGIGASLTKGFRWNSLHTKLVYTSESRSLATLEVTVHLDLSEDLPSDRYYVEIEIPDDLTILEVSVEDLPDDWNAKPPGITTPTIGDDFVAENQAAVLKVPSAIVPGEYNFLINPAHPDAKRIKVKARMKMGFDGRLRGK
jgi:RES domain-containing protein